jgi:DNA-binding GntR family transcriptional regulator
MSRVSGVAEQVRVMILRGEIGLGEAIVDERLQQELRVRRGLLREALRRLEGQGLLVSSHSGAMRVIEIDRDVLREALLARVALEEPGAGLAARRFRDGTVADGLDGAPRASSPHGRLLAAIAAGDAAEAAGAARRHALADDASGGSG